MSVKKRTKLPTPLKLRTLLPIAIKLQNIKFLPPGVVMETFSCILDKDTTTLLNEEETQLLQKYLRIHGLEEWWDAHTD